MQTESLKSAYSVQPAATNRRAAERPAGGCRREGDVALPAICAWRLLHYRQQTRPGARLPALRKSLGSEDSPPAAEPPREGPAVPGPCGRGSLDSSPGSWGLWLSGRWAGLAPSGAPARVHFLAFSSVSRPWTAPPTLGLLSLWSSLFCLLVPVEDPCDDVGPPSRPPSSRPSFPFATEAVTVTGPGGHIVSGRCSVSRR